jgi:SET domain-containing protein
LVTPTFIPENSLVLEYRGEIISQYECIERTRTIYRDMDHFYFLDYESGEVIDGTQKGTVGRFVNHSCDPNCRIEKWYFFISHYFRTVGGEIRVGLFALRDIAPGVELTYDYRFEAYGDMKKCLCGSEHCRGFIGVNKKLEVKPVGND